MYVVTPAGALEAPECAGVDCPLVRRWVAGEKIRRWTRCVQWDADVRDAGQRNRALRRCAEAPQACE